MLEAGKLADVVIFNGDPSHDVALLEREPAAVFTGGQRVDLARLAG
jgi:imidazolonepropionase-like amidohydrolase